MPKPKIKETITALAPLSGSTDTNIFAAIAPEGDALLNNSEKTSSPEVDSPTSEEAGSSSFQGDVKMVAGEAEKSTSKEVKKKVKVGYYIDPDLAEEFRKIALMLQIEGIKIDRGEIIEWGIRKAIKNLTSENSSLKKKLMKR